MFTNSDGFTPLYGFTIMERKTPVVVDVSYGMLWNVYMQSPHLRIIVDRGAEMFGNAEVKLIGADGKEILEHPVLAMLRKPTPLHTLEEWLRWIWVMDCIYANSFIYSLSAFNNTQPVVMWVLPSWDMKIIPTGKLYKQTKIEEIISHYESVANKDNKYETKDIIQLVTGVGQDPLLGQSKIPSLQLHISNSNASLTSRNINLTEMGPKGIITSATGDADGALGLDKKERERLEEQWTKNYGIRKGQRRVSITEAAVDWKPISFPTSELMMFEETEDNFQAMCGAFNMHRHIFPTADGATYENAKQAERGTYQSTMQPRADSLATKLTERLKAFIPAGSKIEFDYSWLPIMQEDKQEAAQEKKTIIEALNILYTSGIISPEQYAIRAGVEMDGDKVIKAKTPAQLPPAGAAGQAQ